MILRAYHTFGLPDDIRALIHGLPYIFARRGRRRRGHHTQCVHRYIRIIFDPLSGYRRPLFLLYNRLLRDGFFNYFCTNNGKGVYLHQIVNFYCNGGRRSWLVEGATAAKGDVDCHHFNGNTLDNRPRNLVALSTNDHKIVTMHQRGVSRRRIAKHSFHANSDSHTLYNRQGKLIRNHAHFLANIIAMTLYYTNEWIRNAKGYLKGSVQWLGRLVSRLQLGLDTSFLPNPVFEFQYDLP